MSDNKNNKETSNGNSFITGIIIAILILGGFICLANETKTDLQEKLLEQSANTEQLIHITNNIYYTLIVALIAITCIYLIFVYKAYILFKQKNQQLDKKLKKVDANQVQIANAIQKLNSRHQALKEAMNDVELIKIETKKIQTRIEEKEQAIQVVERKIERFRQTILENARLTEYNNRVGELTQKVESGEDVTFFLNKLSIEIEEDKEIITLDKKNELLIICFSTLGKIYFQQEENYHVITVLSKYIKIKNDNEFIHNLLGLSYLKIGNIEYALNEFTTAIDIDENQHESYYNRGIAYNLLNQYNEAFEDFNTALDINSSFVEAYMQRSLTYVYKQDYENALADLEKVKIIKSDYAEAYLNCAKIYADLNEYRKAKLELDKAIQINSTLSDAFFFRGIYSLKIQDLDNAIEDFQETIKLSPYHTESYNNLGVISAEKEDFDQAIHYFTQSLNINPSDYIIYYNRGLAYELKNKYAEALNDYYRSIEIESDIEHTQIIQSAINELENKGYKRAVDANA